MLQLYTRDARCTENSASVGPVRNTCLRPSARSHDEPLEVSFERSRDTPRIAAVAIGRNIEIEETFTPAEMIITVCTAGVVLIKFSNELRPVKIKRFPYIANLGLLESKRFYGQSTG